MLILILNICNKIIKMKSNACTFSNNNHAIKSNHASIHLYILHYNDITYLCVLDITVVRSPQLGGQ